MSVETTRLAVMPGQPEADRIEQAAAVLRAGGLVAFPTETVYGLGANALDPAAVAKIYAAKGRPAADPLIVHLHDAAQLATVARADTSLLDELAARFWPGPLTLVLPRQAAVPDIVTAGRATVAVRVPSHPVARALLAAADVPVAAPSANRFSRPSPTTAAHVLADLNGRIDLVLDGGPTTVGVESTVLDMTQSPPVVLRPGGVALEALRALVPAVTHHARYLADDDTAITSPGTLLKHYSPDADLLLYVGSPGATLDAMQRAVREQQNDGRHVGLLLADEDVEPFADTDAVIVTLGSRDDLAGVARRLFAALRELDERGVDVILARGFTHTGLGLALHDRLVRAAAGRVIDIRE